MPSDWLGFLTEELGIEKDKLWVTVFMTMKPQTSGKMLPAYPDGFNDLEKKTTSGRWVTPAHAGHVLKSTTMVSTDRRPGNRVDLHIEI